MSLGSHLMVFHMIGSRVLWSQGNNSSPEDRAGVEDKWLGVAKIKYRPIRWISATDKGGQDNLAPFSQFTDVSFDPPTIL